ncbi:MAG: DNA-formamidopyrimidine glycosylase family protein [Planctomycetota bacterium]|nr:DNA-formamidopyrimidine glycosylase family protein [Planctomycetota bacterium]
MPELPEVERGRKVAELVALGRTVARARCADDRIVFCDQSPRTVARRLTGRTVTAACRHGKQLWIEFDQGPALLLHFGMTGAVHGYASDEERPRFWKIELEFENGHRLAMPDPRRFGRIRLREDPRGEPPISLLGFDPLLEPPTFRRFKELVGSRTISIKGLLLDQSFCAGVGNWIADEILYQAGVAPQRPACSLDEAELKAIRRWLVSIVRKAVSVDSVSQRFPRTWLFHHRWGRPEDALTSRGESIEIATVAGRTTAWVPEAQH